MARHAPESWPGINRNRWPAWTGIRTPYARIDVKRVSGPIEHMEGSWWLLPQENGRILLVYELALDPGMPIPRFLVRATLRRDLPKVMNAVRERAEAAR